MTIKIARRKFIAALSGMAFAWPLAAWHGVLLTPSYKTLSGDRLNAIWGPQEIVCPKCEARLVFVRTLTPRFDSCGFESYRLECDECGSSLAGIIDPYDETLLLSQLEA